jgi:tyrosine-protein phosphatase SIW14
VPKRFAVVEPGILYRSSQPSTCQIEHLAKPDTIGLRTIVIVREGTSRRVPNEMEFARELGLNVLHIPIESRKPVPDDQVAEFFACVDDPEMRPVLVHCSAGRHRTGYLCALYRIERQGWTVQRALDEMLSFGFDTESQSAVQRQLEAYEPVRSATPSSQPQGGD